MQASGGSKTMDSLLSLKCPRRVLLTGTPVQNNLDELYGAAAPTSQACLAWLRSMHAALSRTSRPGKRAVTQADLWMPERLSMCTPHAAWGCLPTHHWCWPPDAPRAANVANVLPTYCWWQPAMAYGL